LAKTGDKADINRQDFIFEPKLDGYRALCFANKRVRFMSRNGNDMSADYPELSGIRKNIKARSCILDGEIVVFNKKGNPDFNLLQRKDQIDEPAVYIIFDIVMKNGKSLCSEPLSERKKILAATVKPSPEIRLIVFTNNGQKLWKAMRARNLEGIMGKKINSRYYPGERTNAWLKIKQVDTLDCVVLGYTTEKRAISSLALGLYDKHGTLHYIGKVGTGFSEKKIAELSKRFSHIARKTKPVKEEVPFKNIHWVKPQVVVEVSYNEFTPYKRLRAGRLVRIRTDKKAKDCTFTQ
jgi:bifunctional non-homologous end joining protein LigD